MWVVSLPAGSVGPVPSNGRPRGAVAYKPKAGLFRENKGRRSGSPAGRMGRLAGALKTRPRHSSPTRATRCRRTYAGVRPHAHPLARLLPVSRPSARRSGSPPPSSSRAAKPREAGGNRRERAAREIDPQLPGHAHTRLDMVRRTRAAGHPTATLKTVIVAARPRTGWRHTRGRRARRETYRDWYDWEAGTLPPSVRGPW